MWCMCWIVVEIENNDCDSLFLSPPPSLPPPPPLLSSLPPSLSLSGRDVNSEPCQRFFREGLTTSFIRILTDDAVSTWKPDIQVIL